MYTTELTNLLRDSDYLIWYCSALDDYKTCTKKRDCIVRSIENYQQNGSQWIAVCDSKTGEVIWSTVTNDLQWGIDIRTKGGLLDDLCNQYRQGVTELVQGQVNQEIWKYQTITGIDIPEFCSGPKKVLKDTKLSNSKVKYQAIQAVCPNKSRLTFTKSDLMQIYEAAKIIDYEKVRKLVDADKQEIKKWIWKYTDGEYTSCIHFRELVDILENKCETLS